MKNQQTQRGFGIIEVMVSAIIIIIIVGGSVTLIRSMIKKNIASSERIQAYNLAREGLEIARAARDTAWIDQAVNAWCYYLDGCTLDDMNVSSQSVLTKNSDGKYIMDDGTTEEIVTIDGVNFIRTYNIEPLNNIPSIAAGIEVPADVTRNVTVKVSWGGDSNNENMIQASTLLTDWKPQ